MEKLPREGFLKVTKGESPPLKGPDKVKLIRRGNTFFQEGKIEEARRIFITTRNTDGLIRVGDYYRDHQRPYEAVKMYRLAPAPDRLEEMAYKMAETLKAWLQTRDTGESQETNSTERS